MAESDEQLCRLVSEFGRVCERRRLRVSKGKIKEMRCSGNVNVGRMDARLNDESLNEVDWFKYQWCIKETRGTNQSQ